MPFPACLCFWRSVWRVHLSELQLLPHSNLYRSNHLVHVKCLYRYCKWSKLIKIEIYSLYTQKNPNNCPLIYHFLPIHRDFFWYYCTRANTFKPPITVPSIYRASLPSPERHGKWKFDCSTFTCNCDMFPSEWILGYSSNIGVEQQNKCKQHQGKQPIAFQNGVQHSCWVELSSYVV